MVRERAAEMEAKERERQRRAMEAKLRFRADLEAQMKENAHRRSEVCAALRDKSR